jgi:hypothetical protein
MFKWHNMHAYRVLFTTDNSDVREIADQNRPEELRTAHVYTKKQNALKTAQRVRWDSMADER